MSKKSRRLLREVIINSYKLKKKKITVQLKFSTNLQSILKILVKEGYIEGYTFIEDVGLVLFLKYVRNNPAVYTMVVSKNLTLTVKRLKLKLNSEMYKDTIILSTSKGIKTGFEALKQSIGGEVLFIIR